MAEKTDWLVDTRGKPLKKRNRYRLGTLKKCKCGQMVRGGTVCKVCEFETIPDGYPEGEE